jgi:hypothetical protein
MPVAASQQRIFLLRVREHGEQAPKRGVGPVEICLALLLRRRDGRRHLRGLRDGFVKGVDCLLNGHSMTKARELTVAPIPAPQSPIGLGRTAVRRAAPRSGPLSSNGGVRSVQVEGDWLRGVLGTSDGTEPDRVDGQVDVQAGLADGDRCAALLPSHSS